MPTNENVLKFLEKVKADKNLSERVEKAETLKDLVLIAEQEGFNITPEEMDKEINGKGELSNDELENLSGGVNLSGKGTGFATCKCSWMD